MSTVTLKFDSVDQLRKFNKTMSSLPGDFDMEQGRYYIDAKSVMGIMSLNLSKPIELHFQAEGQEKSRIISAMNEFTLKRVS